MLLGAFCAVSFPALCVKFPIEGGSWKKTGPPSAFLKMLLLSEGEYTKIGVSKSGILFKICVLCLQISEDFTTIFPGFNQGGKVYKLNR